MDKPKHLTAWQDHLALDFMEKHGSRSTTKGGYKYKIANQIKSYNYKVVVDVGAGLGHMFEVFKNIDGNIEYTAVEITEKYVEHMKSKGINSLQCIDSIPLNDNSADCVISFEVINHQIDYIPYLDELLRIAKNKVYISFFKKFQEDAKLGIDYSGIYAVHTSSLGLIEDRGVYDNEVACIYNFINKEELEKYLDSLGLDYKFDKFGCTDIVEVLTMSFDGQW